MIYLPTELWHLVFSFICPLDLLTLRAVSKHFADLVEDGTVWWNIDLLKKCNCYSRHDVTVDAVAQFVVRTIPRNSVRQLLWNSMQPQHADILRCNRSSLEELKIIEVSPESLLLIFLQEGFHHLHGIDVANLLCGKSGIDLEVANIAIAKMLRSASNLVNFCVRLTQTSTMTLKLRTTWWPHKFPDLKEFQLSLDNPSVFDFRTAPLISRLMPSVEYLHLTSYPHTAYSLLRTIECCPKLRKAKLRVDNVMLALAMLSKEQGIASDLEELHLVHDDLTWRFEKSKYIKLAFHSKSFLKLLIILFIGPPWQEVSAEVYDGTIFHHHHLPREAIDQIDFTTLDEKQLICTKQCNWCRFSNEG